MEESDHNGTQYSIQDYNINCTTCYVKNFCNTWYALFSVITNLSYFVSGWKELYEMVQQYIALLRSLNKEGIDVLYSGITVYGTRYLYLSLYLSTDHWHVRL